MTGAHTPTEILADHRRSFDRDQRIEHERHVLALVEEKRRAHQSRGFDRLFSAVPSARAMLEKLAERGANLGAATSGLLQPCSHEIRPWLRSHAHMAHTSGRRSRAQTG